MTILFRHIQIKDIIDQYVMEQQKASQSFTHTVCLSSPLLETTFKISDTFLLVFTLDLTHMTANQGD